MNQIYLEMNHIKKTFGELEVLKDISLSVHKGEVVSVIGPSGSGKSTLAAVLAGNEKFTVTEGSATFLGRDLLEMPIEDRARLVRSFALRLNRNPDWAPGNWDEAATPPEWVRLATPLQLACHADVTQPESEDILREIEGVRNELVVDWRAENLEEKSGRITRGAALALKSRVLLYAASPQFNPSGEKSKWAAAAAAAFEVINMGIYSLHPDYGGLFVAETSTTSPETIWAVRMGATNEFERKNYPIGTQGGGTGICPSQNLVEAYESTGEDTGDAYAGLDPRFYATVLRNGDTWNGRTLEIYAGGADDPARQNASPTGYYLRKFLNENLNLTNDDKRLRSWIVFRYAEILLNFAEAMNEAYGPDDAHGYGMSARDAVDAVRARSGVGMPPVDVAPGDAAAMRTAIKHERRIELAFEDHRYWDLRRWDDAGTVLNRPLRGVKVTRSGDGFAYTPFEVAKRIFDAPKMNLYPIPQAEIVKSGGVLDQNPGW